jgi:hypothetical protein
VEFALIAVFVALFVIGIMPWFWLKACARETEVTAKAAQEVLLHVRAQTHANPQAVHHFQNMTGRQP